MSIKRKVSYSWQSPFKDADGEDIELELSFQTHDDRDPILQKKLKNGILVVGYLAHDEDCRSPIEDCDGMGFIYHASERRGNAQERHDFECAMGMKDPDSDEELDEFHADAVKIVEQAWRKRNPDLDIDNPMTRQTIKAIHLAEDVLSDVPHNGVPGTTWKDLIETVKVNLWKGANSDPHAVPLDIYEHGGMCYALSHSPEARNFPDQQWDVSHASACWVPDDCAREALIVEAAKRCGFEVKVIHTCCVGARPEDCKPWELGIGKKRFSSWDEAGKYARNLAINKKGAEKFREAEQAVAREFAKSTIDEYNRWLGGECYGVVVEWFDAEGQQIDNDTCWGFIGDEYAKEELEGYFTSNLEHLSEGRTQEKIVNNCKTFVKPEKETKEAIPT